MSKNKQKGVDPHIQPFLDLINTPEAQEKARTMTVEEGRKGYLEFALLHAGWPLRIRRVEDFEIPGADPNHPLPVRLYTPVLDKKLPCLIYYHGGGWQRGDIATHDSICRHLAHYGNVIVLSVEWRLDPEYPFPAGINDCLKAYEWVVANGKNLNIDTSRLAIGGDSAGGNMTAVTAQRLRKMNTTQPIFQLLLYPALDLGCSKWSYEEFAEGYFLTSERVRCYVSQYLNSPDEVNNPLASPLRQPDLSGLPKTHIATAEFDPLRAEGEEYAQRLKEAGISVTYHCYEGMIHAFAHMNDTVPAVEAALQELGGILKEALYN